VHDVLDLRDLVADELAQRRETGHDVAALEPVVAAAVRAGDAARLEEVLERLEALAPDPAWQYEEPTASGEIRACLGAAPAAAPAPAQLGDRLHAAWLGRCAGCLLGKPVEGWPREAIRNGLARAGIAAVEDYLPPLEGLPLHRSWEESTRGRIAGMARDDDIDYTILGLHVLETHGRGYTSRDVADEWLDHLPFTQVYTAERAAYRNLVGGLQPPETAIRRNPYREWIGAQIRADVFGYVSPGDPRGAAALAYPDAALSHVANGIYGELWAAALIAASFTAASMPAALGAALAEIPPRSRLAEALRDVAAAHAAGATWEQARDGIEARLGHYGFVHTINNAAVVAAALLWGEGDFTRTIALAVTGGWDTDCNGATAGSAFGAMHGTDALPGHWTEPLQDRVRSAIAGFDGASIAALAGRTARLAAR